MGVLVSNNELGRQMGTDPSQRTVRITLLLSFAILAVAMAYFAALYLITH